MSYGVDICPRCGGEVRTYDGYGGTCPNCGNWVSAGTVDSIQEEIDREKERDAIRKERMKHIVKVVVECSEADDDRIYRWSKEFDNVEDARKWAHSQSGCSELIYYDKDGVIE